MQALWCWRNQEGEKASIHEITDELVELNTDETTDPNPANVKVYQELQALQDETSAALRDVFSRHRAFVRAHR